MLKSSPTVAKNLGAMIFLVPIFSLVACGEKPGEKKAERSQDASVSVESDLDLERYSVSLTGGIPETTELQVRNLVVANKLEGSMRVGQLSYSTNPSADYVEVKLCQSNGKCADQQLTLRKVTLKALEPGEVQVKARSCIRPERLDGSVEPCGEWNLATFVQPTNKNIGLESLNNRLANLESRLEGLSKQLQEVLTTFDEEARACVARGQFSRQLQGLRIITKNILNLGDRLVFDMIKNGKDDSSAIVPQDRERAKKFADVIEEAGGLIDAPLGGGGFSSEGFALADSVQDSLSRALSGFRSQKTTGNAVNYLGAAFFDIFTAEQQAQSSLNRYPCLAEKTAKSSISVIYAEIQSTNQKIASLSQCLAEASESEATACGAEI